MTKEIEIKILEYIINGWAQTTIAEALHIRRQKVNYYTKKFLKNRWIKPVDKRSNVQLYTQTKTTPSLSYFSLRESNHGLPTQETLGVEIHHLSYKMKALNDPKFKNWDKISKLKNGVIRKYLYWEDTTLCYYENPKSDNFVVIYMPVLRIQHSVEKDELMDNWLRVAYGFSMKILKCNLGLPELNQDAHFAMPNPIPSLQGKKGSIKLEKFWIDSSDGPQCLETHDYDTLRFYQDLPNIIKEMKQQHNQEIKQINTQLDHMDEMLSKVLYINKKLYDTMNNQSVRELSEDDPIYM